MKTIWKCPLVIRDEQTVVLPSDAKPLCVQTQAGQLCLWALVTPALAAIPFLVRIFGTGHMMADDDLQYVGTVVASSEQLVWHVFMKAAPEEAR